MTPTMTVAAFALALALAAGPVSPDALPDTTSHGLPRGAVKPEAGKTAGSPADHPAAQDAHAIVSALVRGVGSLDAEPTREAVMPGREVTAQRLARQSQDFTEGTVSIALVSYPGAETSSKAGRYMRQLVEKPVSRFWTDQLGERFTLDVVHAGKVSLPSGPCSHGNKNDALRLPNESMFTMAEEQLGTEFTTSQHILFAWEEPSAYCGAWAGMAWVNPQPYQRGALWINGLSWDRQGEAPLVAHEFGHVFSLGHASALGCADSSGVVRTDLPWGECTQEEYGSTIDAMGGVRNLGPVSAAALIRARLDEGLNPVTVDTRRSSEVTLLPFSPSHAERVSTPGLARAAALTMDGVTYTLEWRDGSGYDKALVDRHYKAGVGVYLTATITDPASLPEGDADGIPWRRADTFLLDGDTRTREEETTGYSRHLPLFRPVRLHNGSHITVVSLGDFARVHFTPAGQAPPRPDRPGPVKGLDAAWVRGRLLLAWQGDGTGTDFRLQVKRGGGPWRNRSYEPFKPGQPQVETFLALPPPGESDEVFVRVAAKNSSGVSSHVSVRVPALR